MNDTTNESCSVSPGGDDAGSREVTGSGRLNPWWRNMLFCGVSCLVWVTGAWVILYLWGMIFYNGPFQQAGVANLILACLWVAAAWFIWTRIEQRRWKWSGLTMLIAIVMVPWSLIQPSNDRAWIAEHSRAGYTDMVGDQLTIHHVRNFDYTDGGATRERWEQRRVHMSNLRGMDIFHDAFMGDLMGHPVLSFDFGPDGRICLSVEARREVGEDFSPFGGLYKMFELQYLFSTEEDCIRLRTHIRKEPVYMYEINAPLEDVREMFLSSVRIQNDLAKKPRFYNVTHTNCTTTLRGQRPEGKRGSWDPRILFNGLLDEYLYERGRLVAHGMSFEELRKRAKINPDKVPLSVASDFSVLIRLGRFEKD